MRRACSNPLELEEAADGELGISTESGEVLARTVEELDLNLEVLAVADTELCTTLENTTDSRDKEVRRTDHLIEAQQQELRALASSGPESNPLATTATLANLENPARQSVIFMDAIVPTHLYLEMLKSRSLADLPLLHCL